MTPPGDGLSLTLSCERWPSPTPERNGAHVMNLAQASGILNFLETGTDVTVYFVMAMIATLLFVIRLVFALFIGDAGDSGDFDMDVQHAADLSGDAFQMFSLLSITAFFMGVG